MLRLVLQLSVRNILRHKRRNLMLFAAIAVAVAAVSASNTLIRGFQAELVDSAISNLTGHVKIHVPGYREDPNIDKSFELAADFQPDIPPQLMLGWAPRVRVPAVIMSERETRGVQLVGVDPEAEHISFLGRVAIEGAGLNGVDDGGILIGAELAKQLATKLGRRLVINTQGADGLSRERGFKIVGIYDADGTSLEKVFAFSGLATVQKMLDSAGVTEVSVRLHDEPQSLSIKERLLEFFIGLEVMDWRELEPQAAAMDMFADSAVFIWFALLMSALIFGLVNTLVATVMERVREFGLLRAVGMRNSVVICQVMIESAILMSIGTVVGLICGYLVFLGIADGIDLAAFAEGMADVGVGSVLVPVFFVDDFVLVAALSLSLGVLASLYPAWRAVKVPPLNAMRR